MKDWDEDDPEGSTGERFADFREFPPNHQAAVMVAEAVPAKPMYQAIDRFSQLCRAEGMLDVNPDWPLWDPEADEAPE